MRIGFWGRTSDEGRPVPRRNHAPRPPRPRGRLEDGLRGVPGLRRAPLDGHPAEATHALLPQVRLPGTDRGGARGRARIGGCKAMMWGFLYGDEEFGAGVDAGHVF